MDRDTDREHKSPDETSPLGRDSEEYYDHGENSRISIVGITYQTGDSGGYLVLDHQEDRRILYLVRSYRGRESQKY